MMKTKQKTSWWIDIVLFVGFLVAFFLSLTGVELHEWVGIFGGLLAGYHLLAHWNWVDTVSRKIFRNSSGIVRLKFWVDGLMFAGFVLIIGTGLVISSWMNLALSNYSAWLSIHILASITTLLILVLKLAMHWRWIFKTGKDAFEKPAFSLEPQAKLQSVPVERGSIERRDFLKVMGVVAGGSLIALMSATNSLASLQGGETSTASQSETIDPGQWSFNQLGEPRSSKLNTWDNGTCTVQCGRRCSYPGQCRRYTDSNNNNRCDYGECV
jgi:hypothetical protein